MKLTRKAKKIWAYALTSALVLTAAAWPSPQKAAAAGEKFYWLDKEQTDITVLEEDAAEANTITLKNTSLDSIGNGYIDSATKKMSASDITLTVNDTYTFDYGQATVDTYSFGDKQKLDFANKYSSSMSMNEKNSRDNAVLEMVKNSGLKLTANESSVTITGYTITFKTKQLKQTASGTATATPVGTATATPVGTATATPVGTATATPVGTATATPVGTATATPVGTATATPVGTATATPVGTATATPKPAGETLGENDYLIWSGSWTKVGNDSTDWGKTEEFLKVTGSNATTTHGTWNWGITGLDLSDLKNPTIEVSFTALSTPVGKVQVFTDSEYKNQLSGKTADGKFTATLTSDLKELYLAETDTKTMTMTKVRIYDAPVDPNATPKPTVKPLLKDEYMRWEGSWKKNSEDNETTGLLMAEGSSVTANITAGGGWWWMITGLNLSGLENPVMEVGFKLSGDDRLQVFNKSSLESADEITATLVSDGIYQVPLTTDMANVWLSTYAAGTSEYTSISIFDNTLDYKKAKLADDITNAEGLKQTDYTASSWEIFQTALTAAKGIAEKADATADEIETTRKALLSAVNKLIKYTPATASPSPTPGAKATPTPDATATPIPTPGAPITVVGLAKNAKTTVGNFSYQVTQTSVKNAGKVISGKVTVVAMSKKGKKAKKLSVPATIKANGATYSVTAIGAKAMKDAKATTITLGKNVKSIGKNAFAGCKKLSKLSIKAKLSSVKKGAFKGCKKKIKVSGTSKKQNLKKLKKSGYKKFK